MTVACSDRMAFVDGELDAELAEAFRDHVRSCEICRAALPGDVGLAAQLSTHPPSRGSAALVKEIRAAIDAAAEALDDPDKMSPATMTFARTILIANAISDALDLGLEQIRQLLEVVAARGGR